jgi:hypothetical protein
VDQSYSRTGLRSRMIAVSASRETGPTSARAGPIASGLLRSKPRPTTPPELGRGGSRPFGVLAGDHHGVAAFEIVRRNSRPRPRAP